MKVDDVLRDYEGHPFAVESFTALGIPDAFYHAAALAMKRANATPVDVRRYRETSRDMDAVLVMGRGADGAEYQYGDLIKEGCRREHEVQHGQGRR